MSYERVVNYQPVQRVVSYGTEPEQQPVIVQQVPQKEGGSGKLWATLAGLAVGGATVAYMMKKGKASEAAGKVAEAGEKVAGKATEKVAEKAAEKASEVAQDASKKGISIVASLKDGIKDERRLKLVNGVLKGDSIKKLTPPELKDVFEDLYQVRIRAEGQNSTDVQKIDELLTKVTDEILANTKNYKSVVDSGRSVEELTKLRENATKEVEYGKKQLSFFVESERYTAAENKEYLDATRDVIEKSRALEKLKTNGASEAEIKVAKGALEDAELVELKASNKLDRAKESFIQDRKEQMEIWEKIRTNKENYRAVGKDTTIAYDDIFKQDISIKEKEKDLELLYKLSKPIEREKEEFERLKDLSEIIKKEKDNAKILNWLSANKFNDTKELETALREAEVNYNKARINVAKNVLSETNNKEDYDFLKKFIEEKRSVEAVEKELKTLKTQKRIFTDSADMTSEQIEAKIKEISLNGKLSSSYLDKFKVQNIEEEKTNIIRRMYEKTLEVAKSTAELQRKEV